METSKHESGFRNGEWRTDVMEIIYFIVGSHYFRCTEVDATQDDMRLFAWLDVRLQRRLTIEFYRKIYHIATFHKAIRRSISPSTGNIYAHRRPSPYYLVAMNRHLRRLAHVKHRRSQALTEYLECFLSLL